MFPCEKVEVWAQDYLIALVWTNQDFFSQLLTAVKEDIKSLLFVVTIFTEDLLSFKTTIIKMHANSHNGPAYLHYQCSNQNLLSPLALPVYKAKTQTVAVIVLKQNGNHMLELE